MPPIKMRGVQKPKNTWKTVFRLLSYLGKFRVLMALTLFLSAFSAAAGVFGTWLLKPALNDYILPFIGKSEVDLTAFAKLIFVLIFVYALGAICTFASARILLFLSTKTLMFIRSELFEKVEILPLSWHDSKTHGEIMSLFTNDTDTLRDMFSQSVPQLFTSVLQVLLVFVMMCLLSLPLTILLVFLTILSIFASAILAKKSASAFRSQQSQIAKANGFIEELISSRLEVKAFAREKKTMSDFEKLNDSLCEAGTRANTWASVIGPVTNNLSHLQYAFIATAGAFLVIFGKSDIGTVAAFLQSARTFSQPLSQMSQQFNAVLNALAGAERIFAAIDEREESFEGSVNLVPVFEDSNGKLIESQNRTGKWAWKASSTGQLKILGGKVDFQGVNFSYDGKKQILKDVSIFVENGKKLALVGSTGSGKTTIASLLVRFYDVKEDCGRIFLDEIPISDIALPSLRRALGMVLQDVHLFTGTVFDNIRYGNPDATDEDVKAAARLANAHSFISRLPQGYDTVIRGDGASLSHGQKQLLSIARASCADSPILILDEATSSIDTRTESLVQSGMNHLMKNRTVLVIAHRLSTVRGADQIAVLENGSVLEKGTHDELINRRGRYWQLCSGGLRLE